MPCPFVTQTYLTNQLTYPEPEPEPEPELFQGAACAHARDFWTLPGTNERRAD